MNKGLMYVFGGEGKGKTSACIGVAVRSLLIKRKVLWISWYKTKEWPVSEMKLDQVFENIDMYWSGKGFYFKTDKGVKKIKGRKFIDMTNSVVYDNYEKVSHQQSAKAGLDLAMSALKSNQYQLVILDEVLNAVEDRLVTRKELENLLSLQKESDLVLSGRKIPKWLINASDLVSKIDKIKHPFDAGVLAKKGLDY